MNYKETIDLLEKEIWFTENRIKQIENYTDSWTQKEIDEEISFKRKIIAEYKQVQSLLQSENVSVSQA